MASTDKQFKKINKLLKKQGKQIKAVKSLIKKSRAKIRKKS